MVNFIRGPFRTISQGIKEFEISNIGNNRFVVVYRDSQDFLNIVAGHVIPSGPSAGIQIDAIFEPVNSIITRKLGSVAGLSNMGTIRSFIVSIINENGVPMTITFLLSGNSIMQFPFANNIGFSTNHNYLNSDLTGYTASLLLHSTFSITDNSGVTLAEVEWFGGEPSFVIHDGIEFNPVGGNPLNVCSKKVQSGSIIHQGGRI